MELEVIFSVWILWLVLIVLFKQLDFHGLSHQFPAFKHSCWRISNKCEYILSFIFEFSFCEFDLLTYTHFYNGFRQCMFSLNVVHL